MKRYKSESLERTTTVEKNIKQSRSRTRKGKTSRTTNTHARAQMRDQLMRGAFAAVVFFFILISITCVVRHTCHLPGIFLVIVTHTSSSCPTLANSLELIEGSGTLCVQPWMSLDLQPFPQKATQQPQPQPHTHIQQGPTLDPRSL